MELVNVFFAALGSVVLLFILTKIMGNKQMSQLSMFDYITGITIGSIAAEMATALEGDFFQPLIALLVYALLSVIISVVTRKSIVLRRLLTGKSIVLFDKGELYAKNFKKARIDVNEFLTQCRNSGYFDIKDLHTAILEPNGKISFLPLSANRNVTPSDLKLTLPEDTPLVNVIVDGKILTQNLAYTGHNERWLEKKLRDQGISQASEVFLATYDYQGDTLNIYVRLTKPMKRDTFE